MPSPKEKEYSGVELYDSWDDISFKAVSVTDLLVRDFPPRENLLSPWLSTQSLSMVYAPRGIGKTFFALGVAYAVASGTDFLNWEATAPKGVLYIDGEMPAVTMQERLLKMGLNPDYESAKFFLLNPEFQDKRMINVAYPEDQKRLDELLDGIALIIVDNISTLCVAGNENDSDSWETIQNWAIKQRSKGRSVIFVHHAGKSGSQRGTSRREDVLDNVIALRQPSDYTPDRGACFEVHFEKARGLYGDTVKPFLASLETESGGLIWATQDLEASRTETIVQLLEEGLKQNEIAEMLNLSKGAVSKHVTKARNAGLLK